MTFWTSPAPEKLSRSTLFTLLSPRPFQKDRSARVGLSGFESRLTTHRLYNVRKLAALSKPLLSSYNVGISFDAGCEH